MKTEKIKVDSYRIPELISEIQRGNLRIPRFQRDYVWPRTKVVKLLDSIYNEYPIGSFFFWDAPPEYNFFYKEVPELNIPKPDNYSNIRFILDGQQRITSLYVALGGLQLGNRNSDDYSKIAFDLDKENFFVVRGSRLSKKHNPFYKMLNEDEQFRIFENLDEKQRKTFQHLNKIFSTYPLSVVYVRGIKLDEAVEIFERINQGGKPLSLFDLVVASTWTPDFDLKERIESDINGYLKEKGFGKIEPGIVSQLVALITKGGCTNAFQLQMKTKEIKGIWKQAVDSLKLAIDFLSENLGVKIYDFIPYPAIIPLVSYFYYKKDNKAFTQKETETINKWFWRASFSERYASATLTRMTEDKKTFDKIAEGEIVDIDYQVTVTPENLKKLIIYRKSAIKNAIWCILAMSRPRHFANHSFIALDHKILSQLNDLNKHHIFPKEYLRKSDNKFLPHLLMNFCFIPFELNAHVNKNKPSDYFSKYREENPEFEEALQSHLIPNDRSIWENDYGRFIDERARLIYETIERYIGEKISRSLGENNTKVVSQIENRLRKYIDFNLAKSFGLAYWKKKIPSDIIGLVKERAIEARKKDPKVDINQMSNLERLKFCDIMHYSNIILKNWDVFRDIFQSKSEVEKRLNNLKSYRNTLMHSREVDSVTKKEGEASIEWLDKILK